VNIQSDVIHRLHGGASLVSLNQRPLSSAFYTKRSSSDLYIQTYRDFDADFMRGAMIPMRRR